MEPWVCSQGPSRWVWCAAKPSQTSVNLIGSYGFWVRSIICYCDAWVLLLRWLLSSNEDSFFNIHYVSVKESSHYTTIANQSAMTFFALILLDHISCVLFFSEDDSILMRALLLHLVCVDRGAEVDVKRLPKRPAPPRFGRKLSEAQKAKRLGFGFYYYCYYYFAIAPSLHLFCMPIWSSNRSQFWCVLAG